MNQEQRQSLFNYMLGEHGVALLESDIDEIYKIVIGNEDWLKRQNEIMNPFEKEIMRIENERTTT